MSEPRYPLTFSYTEWRQAEEYGLCSVLVQLQIDYLKHYLRHIIKEPEFLAQVNRHLASMQEGRALAYARTLLEQLTATAQADFTTFELILSLHRVCSIVEDTLGADLAQEMDVLAGALREALLAAITGHVAERIGPAAAAPCMPNFSLN